MIIINIIVGRSSTRGEHIKAQRGSLSPRARGSRWACAAHDPMFSDFKHALKRLSRSPGFASAMSAAAPTP